MDVESDACRIPQRLELLKTVIGVATCLTDGARKSDDQGVVEYITHIDRSCNEAQVAAALSSREMKVYSRDTMLLAGSLRGHTGAVTKVAFAPTDPCGLFSSSEDGTVRGWDTRTLEPVVNFGGSGEELWSVALGYDGRLCAAGKGTKVEFYDLRKSGKALGTYHECHTDAVTQLCFDPKRESFLLTGSEDGLLCYLDTAASSEEDAMDSVLNAECAVRTLGFYGSEGEHVYCCTNTNSLSLWNVRSAQRVTDFGDVRALSKEQQTATRGDDEPNEAGAGRNNWHTQKVDYIVGCHYEPQGDLLLLLTGAFEGGACVAAVSPNDIIPQAILEGGHSEEIRAFDWARETIITGGEDSKLCLWRAPGDATAAMEDDVAMDDEAPPRERTARLDATGQHSSGSRRAESRAARSFRPYDVESRRR